MIEEKVEIVVRSADVEMHLTPDECEAGAEFEEECFNVLQQAHFDRTLVGVVAETEEVEEVGVLGDLLCEVRLRRRERLGEIGDGFALAFMKRGADLQGQDVATPAVLGGPPGIPEADGAVFYLLDEDDVVEPRNGEDFGRGQILRRLRKIWQRTCR